MGFKIFPSKEKTGVGVEIQIEDIFNCNLQTYLISKQTVLNLNENRSLFWKYYFLIIQIPIEDFNHSFREKFDKQIYTYSSPNAKCPKSTTSNNSLSSTILTISLQNEHPPY